MRLLRRLSLSLGWFLIVFLAGCGSSDSSNTKTQTALSPDAERLELMRNQINLGLAQRSAWQGHWAKTVGNFDALAFEVVYADSIDPIEMPEKNPIIAGDPLFTYQMPHPEGNGTMDIYSYKVEAQDGLDKPYLNPDSEVIWYRQDGMKERLLFMGPSGMIEDGLWLNAGEFMVLGFFQEEEGYRPMIWIIDVVNHRFTQFKMTKVTQNYLPESYLDAKLVFVDLS